MTRSRKKLITFKYNMMALSGWVSIFMFFVANRPRYGPPHTGRHYSKYFALHNSINIKKLNLNIWLNKYLIIESPTLGNFD